MNAIPSITIAGIETKNAMIAIGQEQIGPLPIMTATITKPTIGGNEINKKLTSGIITHIEGSAEMQEFCSEQGITIEDIIGSTILTADIEIDINEII